MSNIENLNLLHITSFCNMGDSQSLRLLHPETKDTLLKFVPYSLKKYQDKDNEYRKRSITILDILSNAPSYGEGVNCKQLKGLMNIKASCYMDSVIFSLFAIPNDFINTRILDYIIINDSFNCDAQNRRNIQTELRTITDGIRNGRVEKYCNKLRKYFSKCPHPVENFHRGGERDAMEFLVYLLSFFDVDIASKKTVTYGTNNVTDDISKIRKNEKKQTSETLDLKSSILQFTNVYDLMQMDQNINHNIKDFITLYEDTGDLGDDVFNAEDLNMVFKRRISTTTLIDSPYIIFGFNKLSPNGFIKTSIIPSQTISLESGSRFQLIAIVIYSTKHYTSYFKCGTNWYYYNDLVSEMRFVGTFEKLLESKPSPITNGTLYFYSRLPDNLNIQAIQDSANAPLQILT